MSQTDEYEKQDCPMCGEEFKVLPWHLRNECSAGND